MPSIGSTTQMHVHGPTAPPPCSSPTTASPGRSCGQPVADERLDRVVGRGHDVGRRALRGHPGAVSPLSHGPGSSRRCAAAASTATCSAIRRSSRGSSGSGAEPACGLLAGTGSWPDAHSRRPSDHMHPLTRGRARKREGEYVRRYTQLQWTRYPTETAADDQPDGSGGSTTSPQAAGGSLRRPGSW